jgi:uncharacterized MAPEG superfamily protein
MSYLFWFVFFSIMTYMVWQGYADKRAYLRDQAQERDRSKLAEEKNLGAQAAHENATPRTV